MDHRLKKDKQFSYIYRKGKRYNSEHLTLFSVESRFKTFKIGYAVSKKIGKANKRNKLKRRLKEIVRQNNLPKDYFNYVIMARPGAAEIDFLTLQEEVKKIFKVASAKK